MGCTQNPAFLDFKNYNLIESEQFRLGCITGNDSNIFQDSDRNLIFAAQGRIDNPEALEPFLGSCTSGPDYIWKAFLFWGKNCPARLLGDWLFAAYNTLSGELFLARDQNGKRELLYKEVAGGIMFSSNLRPLIKTSRQLNHLQVISLISGWNYQNSDQATIFQNILRLSPGHALSYKSGRIRIEKYWFPEHIPLKHYSIPQDYSDELLEISKKAVACRIPSNLKVGSMLSGGLDSTTISSLAAEIIGDNPLYTFSHVPLYDRFYSSNPRKFYDETEHIKAVVESKTNIQSFLLNSANVSPIDGLERYVKNFNNFIPNGSNSFWVMDIYQQAVDMGLEVLLSGGFGNIALSYRGLADALPMNPGLRTLKRKVLKPLLRNFIEYRNFSNKLKNGFLNKNIIDKYNIKQDVLLNRRAGHRVFKTSQEEILSLMYKTYKSRLIENDSLLKIEKLDPTADIRI
ncbi:MAG TPA: asparagine synthase-related protein, partial [Emticicia sp.]